MNRRVLSLSITMALAYATVAHANVIDFESFPAGPFASFTEQGVTFSAEGGGGLLTTPINPNGTKGLLDANTPRKLFRADIAGEASSVSVDLGDFNADPDTLFLEIFNAANLSLGFASILIDADFTGMLTLSLSAPDIAYAIFGATAPAINGNSVFADNFTWEPETAVPEPGTLVLLGAGLVGAAVLRRGRRS